MKDLILGAISNNYKLEDIRNWIHSIKMSGFQGDVVVFCYNFADDLTVPRYLQEMGATCILPETNNYGQQVTQFEFHSGRTNKENYHMLVHNMRFFHFWQFLTQSEERYRYVFHTDTRDLVFQTNPSDWMLAEFGLCDSCDDIVAPSENVLIKDEPWVTEMIHKLVGPYVYELTLKDRLALNVGSFAGPHITFADMCLSIYQTSLSVNQQFLPALGDQPAFDVLVNTSFRTRAYIAEPSSLYSCQCGTMIPAQFQDKQVESTDIAITDDGVVTNNGKPFMILHQYDRVPYFVGKVNERYSTLQVA